MENEFPGMEYFWMGDDDQYQLSTKLDFASYKAGKKA